MNIKISEDIVKKTADLSKIDLTENEVNKITNSFGPIFEMIDMINNVNIEGKISRNFTNVNTLRDDVVDEKTNLNNKEIIKEFPNVDNDYLKTKKIL